MSSSPFRYRKVVSNNCTDGVREQYTAKPQKCPGKAPRGLRIVTADGKLTAEQGHNVTLMVQLEEVGLIPISPLPSRASDFPPRNHGLVYTHPFGFYLHMLTLLFKYCLLLLVFVSVVIIVSSLRHFAVIFIAVFPSRTLPVHTPHCVRGHISDPPWKAKQKVLAQQLLWTHRNGTIAVGFRANQGSWD